MSVEKACGDHLWNRSGEVSVEFDAEKLTATLYIDGKYAKRLPVWTKLTPRALVSGLWEVETTGETYKVKVGDLSLERNKKKVHVNAYKEFTKIYGTTPTHVTKLFNAAVFKRTILPYKEYMPLFWRRSSIVPANYTNVVKHYDLLEQAKADGQKNLLPVIAALGESPKSLRERFGKGVWKKIANNSYHRNSLLSKFPREMDKIIDCDSSALQYTYSGLSTVLNIELLMWLKHICGIPYSKYKSCTREIRAYVDTYGMADRLGLPFNKKWSLRKMEEKHDEYSRIQQRRMEEQRINWDKAYAEKLANLRAINLSTFYKKTEWEHKGVRAKLLTTYDEVVDEGATMKHCVAGYAERCMEKHYCVISLTDGELRTTLGVNVEKIGKSYKFSFNQHYGKHNSYVEDERFVTLAETVIDDLNEMKLKETNA